MKSLDLIRKIEEQVSDILKTEFNEDSAFFTIDTINLLALDDDTLTYTVGARAGIATRKLQKAFDIPAIAGLPEDIFTFTSKDIFAYSILVANLTLEILDEAASEIFEKTTDKIVC